MAYAYTDPTCIDYILQRGYDELRRGESQHYRSAEAQYANHVKELLGNLERYLEACGVRLPSEVQEGTEISAAAAAADAQESEPTAFSVPPRGHSVGTQRVSQGLHIGGRSASVSAVVGSAKCSSDAVNRQEVTISNPSAHMSGPVRSEWGNLETPCEAQRDSGAANSHHVAGSGLVAAATSTLWGTPLQSNLAHAMSDTSSPPLTAGNQRHPAPDNRSVHATNSESEASILYNSQQVTRAHAAYSSSSPSMTVDVGADGNAENHIASLVYSGDATGVDSCSVDSDSAPIVAIIDSGYGGGNGARSRGRSENATMRSPPAPPKLREYYTGEGARGSSYPIASNAIAAASSVSDASAGATRTAAGLDRWGEFGMFVQSITESRHNSNLASLKGVATAGYPPPEGANSAPGATPKLSFQLPYVLSTGTSMTTPPTPVLAVVAGRQMHQQQLNWGGAKVQPSYSPLQVAHGAGSSAVRALVAAEVVLGSETAGLEGYQRSSPLSGIVSSPIPLAALPRQCGVDEASFGVPQVECIPSPPPHSRPTRPACLTGVAVPMQCAASVSLASHRLRPGGGDGTDSLPHCQRAQLGSVPPHARASAGAVAATAPVASARSSEKEQLMHRLREVLKRSAYASSSVQSPAMPSAVAAEQQSSFSKDPTWGIKGKQDGHVAVGSTEAPAPTLVPSPQPPLPSQRMPNDTAPLPSTARTNGTSNESANMHRSVYPPEPKNGGVAWNRSWDFLRSATVAASGCLYTSSSNDISSKPTTSHGVSCGTARPKDAGDDGGSGSSALPRHVHQSKGDFRAQRYVSNSDKDAIMTTEPPPDVLRADGGRDLGSCTAASITCARAYIKETIALSQIANAQRHPSSLCAATPSMWPACSTLSHSHPGIAMPDASELDGYPPGLTKSGIGDCSRVEKEKLSAYQRHSVGQNGGLTDVQLPSQPSGEERRSFSTGTAPSHAEKQQLMHRLLIVLNRSNGCALSGT
ncbi:hypothetical protein JIQ42_00842 [Leishmania sp. Namibia]|uniref:hypothetical protein n=1 Tax=Leishmania sp. Namibia TaxID=2802991 RepID=UPI001B4653D7|nr:hypothetical protein JIQ42_00842 [Leishmania sp. Namibia]